MSVIQNIVVEYCPVHRFPLTKVLVAGTDFKLNTDGTVKGYGTNPVNELVVGVLIRFYRKGMVLFILISIWSRVAILCQFRMA